MTVRYDETGVFQSLSFYKCHELHIYPLCGMSLVSVAIVVMVTLINLLWVVSQLICTKVNASDRRHPYSSQFVHNNMIVRRLFC